MCNIFRNSEVGALQIIIVFMSSTLKFPWIDRSQFLPWTYKCDDLKRCVKTALATREGELQQLIL